jgi:hypothetical protein
MSPDPKPLPAANRIIGNRIVTRAPRPVGPSAPAGIITFPIVRRRDVSAAKAAAAVMRARSPAAADRSVAKALRSFTNELRAQKIPAVIVKREVHALEARIRGAVWRLLFPWVNEEETPIRRRRQEIRRRSGGATAQLSLDRG